MIVPGASRWARFFPFLVWFPINSVLLRGDLIAGITGALVLVPKAMAYAQLSGLPVHFGLYVALVPAIVGALWGSSRQLATGPVAIISLRTAAALTPLAVPFSAEYIELALLLTLMVGVVQFALGAFTLGTIVNFVSHPVILGFMNAAAIIIALSQLDMLLGIPKGRSGSFLGDIWEMLSYLPQTHMPTLAMSAFALALMLVLKRIGPISKLSVLIAVVVTIVASMVVGYEQNARARALIAVDHDRLIIGQHGGQRRIRPAPLETRVAGAKQQSLHPPPAWYQAHALAEERCIVTVAFGVRQVDRRDVAFAPEQRAQPSLRAGGEDARVDAPLGKVAHHRVQPRAMAADDRQRRRADAVAK